MTYEGCCADPLRSPVLVATGVVVKGSAEQHAAQDCKNAFDWCYHCTSTDVLLLSVAGGKHFSLSHAWTLT